MKILILSLFFALLFVIKSKLSKNKDIESEILGNFRDFSESLHRGPGLFKK